MKHVTEEQIRSALHEQFKYLKEGVNLPELWCVKFKLDIRVVPMMSRSHIQAWFCGFTPAQKLGMWWTMDVDDYVYLHGTRGEKPVVDRLFDLILWLNSLEEPPGDGKISSHNLTLLTTPTEPYSY